MYIIRIIKKYIEQMTIAYRLYSILNIVLYFYKMYLNRIPDKFKKLMGQQNKLRFYLILTPKQLKSAVCLCYNLCRMSFPLLKTQRDVPQLAIFSCCAHVFLVLLKITNHLTSESQLKFKLHASVSSVLQRLL